jgi:PPOX class probable F420-dependent enzyme
MPKPPLPSDLEEFLDKPNPAVIATASRDAAPHTAATWYRCENGRILVNMDRTRKRLQYMRDNPRVSITVMGEDNWYQQVTLRGRTVQFEDDPDFEGADRLSRHYTGEPYPRRDQNRVNAWIEVESWYGWSSGQPWRGDDG